MDLLKTVICIFTKKHQIKFQKYSKHQNFSSSFKTFFFRVVSKISQLLFRPSPHSVCLTCSHRTHSTSKPWRRWSWKKKSGELIWCWLIIDCGIAQSVSNANSSAIFPFSQQLCVIFPSVRCWCFFLYILLQYLLKHSNAPFGIELLAEMCGVWGRWRASARDREM